MFENIKSDIRVNGYHIEKIWILLLYRVGNYVYYSNMHVFIKKPLLFILNIFRKINGKLVY